MASLRQAPTNWTDRRRAGGRGPETSEPHDGARACEVTLEEQGGVVAVEDVLEVPGEEGQLVGRGEEAHVLEVRAFRRQAEISKKELPSECAGQAIRFRPDRRERTEHAAANP